MPINQRQGSYPHVRWVDLKSNGVMVECAIMKEDRIGNLYYVEIAALDAIDRGRLVKILQNRNAGNFELWDLMGQVTLNNGVNALEYFHQLVKVITPAGVVMNPRSGSIGTDVVRQPPVQQPVQQVFTQQPPVQQPPVQQAPAPVQETVNVQPAEDNPFNDAAAAMNENSPIGKDEVNATAEAIIESEPNSPTRKRTRTATRKK